MFEALAIIFYWLAGLMLWNGYKAWKEGVKSV